MPSIFTENLRIYNAEQFKLSVSEIGPNDIYLTFGRTNPWANDSAPPQANSSVSSFNDIWKNMIGAKLISGNDIRHAIPKHDWVYDTVYSQYDHEDQTYNLFNANNQFYVVTSDWNVYKCLSNNYDKPSQIMPTQTVINSPVQETDGYIWKYMYTVNPEERLRFVTGDYIPVRTLSLDNNSLQWRVQQAAISGSIDVISVDNGGNGYMNANTITVTIAGDGTGATAFATVNAASNSVNSVVVSSAGYGYTYGTITITDTGTGANAAAHPQIPPTGGHGSDPLRELGGNYIILNPRLIRAEVIDNIGKFPVVNEYRQISIMQDPKEKSTGNTANSPIYRQTLQLTLSTGSVNYYLDETVYQGPALSTAYFTGQVCAWDSTNNQIQLTNTSGTAQGDVLIGANSAAARFVQSITPKELEEYTGYLLYTDNVSPVQRAVDQTEDFKIILKF